jgi:hypothetical protein
MDKQEFRKLIRTTLANKAKSLNENYMDDDDNLGSYSGDFDPNEFGGEAMRAAMQDIGSEFEPLGKSRFEKNLNPDEFVADLKRQNLNLPNDKKELGDIEKTMNKKRAHEKMFGAGSLNETEELNLDAYQFDMKNLYSYFKDAMYSLKDLEPEEAAQILEATFKRDLPYLGKHLSEGLDFPELMNQFRDNMKRETTPKVSTETPEEKQLRIKNKLAQHREKESNRRSVDDIIKEEGDENNPEQSRYMFFGNLQQIQRQAGIMLDMNEEEVAQILESGHDWAQDHVATAKESFDQVFDFLMNETKKETDENEFEEEIDESMIRSHANGRGENLKPNNFPEEFEREATIETINENLDNATDIDDEVFLVIDNDFNRAHYKDLVGKTFDDAPGYANVEVIKKDSTSIPSDSVESDFHNATQEPVEEEYDYAREERNFHDQENFKDLQQYTDKNLKIKNLDDMYNLVFPDKKRVQSVLDSLKDEINSMHIINDIVAASDYMDTDWLFDITGVDNENVYLDFTGTAK